MNNTTEETKNNINYSERYKNLMEKLVKENYSQRIKIVDKENGNNIPKQIPETDKK